MNRQKKQDNIKRHEIKFAFTNKDENKLFIDIKNLEENLIAIVIDTNNNKETIII